METPIFIQFTGAQGSGKTTLLEELRQIAKVSFSVVGEVSRDLRAASYVKNVDIKATTIEQIMIELNFLLERYRVLGKGDPLILSCRSPMDVYAYALNLAKDDSVLGGYSLDIAIQYILYTLDRKDVNVITFYTEPLDKFEDDGVRNKESVALIDTTIKSIIHSFHIPVIVLKKGTLQERMATIKDSLEKYNLFSFPEVTQ